MFTGLIAELGTVRNLKKIDSSYQLTVGAAKILANLKIGESIAVNGACLTVITVGQREFTVDVMPETVRYTTVGTLKNGDKVNLEKTLRLQDGLDGHIVSGHVEGVGTITRRVQDSIAWLVTITAPENLMKYIIKKGSITIDGISLTVTDVDKNTFTVSIIPHTAKETTLGFKTVGASVNLETDIIGKYVEQMLNFKEKKQGSLDKNKLFENGFL